MRELAVQEAEKVLRRIRLIGKHRASHACKADVALEILVRDLRHRLFQQRQSFFAVTGLGKAHRSFS